MVTRVTIEHDSLHCWFCQRVGRFFECATCHAPVCPVCRHVMPDSSLMCPDCWNGYLQSRDGSADAFDGERFLTDDESRS